ncbi:MAG: molybdopterin-dependent oxidoreductase [Rhodobacteraceae bacterium]|nr:molybdopterin-dependent oxidoreductase [Paracoccaceae bacterium]
MAHRTFFLAADDVVQKGREAAAERLEAAVADIEFSAADGGVFRVAGTDKAVNLFQVAAALEGGDVAIGEGDGELLGEGGVSDRESTYPNGAHIVEVEVDPETGWPHLKRYSIVDDFGRVLNPLLALGQVHGGVAQGVGQALLETAVWDPDTGQPLTGSFMDYCMPRADDFPNFDAELTEASPSITNPLGVKGCGEAGSVGAIPAATLAVLDALRQAGVETLSTPLTPQKIWAALEAAKAKPG